MNGIKTLAPLLFSLAASVTVSASNDNTHSIINGEQALMGAWPSAVALVENNRSRLVDRQFCGGNIIAEKWVLTAAHCIVETMSGGAIVSRETSDFNIAVGYTNLENEESGAEIAVKAYEVHPYYDPNDVYGYYDIAVVELDQATNLPAMSLFAGDLQQHNGSMAIVIGWGATAYPYASIDYPSVLNQLGVPLVSLQVCNQPESYNGTLGKGQFCAGYQQGGADSCVGDSGGPIMLLQDGTYTQIGVVNFGEECAKPNKYGVYADVPFFSSWIMQYVEGREVAQNGIGGEPRPTDPDHSSRIGAVNSSFLLLILLLVWRRWQTYREII